MQNGSRRMEDKCMANSVVAKKLYPHWTLFMTRQCLLATFNLYTSFFNKYGRAFPGPWTALGGPGQTHFSRIIYCNLKGTLQNEVKTSAQNENH